MLSNRIESDTWSDMQFVTMLTNHYNLYIFIVSKVELSLSLSIDVHCTFQSRLMIFWIFIAILIHWWSNSIIDQYLDIWFCTHFFEFHFRHPKSNGIYLPIVNASTQYIRSVGSLLNTWWKNALNFRFNAGLQQ